LQAFSFETATIASSRMRFGNVAASFDQQGHEVAQRCRHMRGHCDLVAERAIEAGKPFIDGENSSF
jgi:hypothetical protein